MQVLLKDLLTECVVRLCLWQPRCPRLTRRPEALRPRLSAGLPFSVEGCLYQFMKLRQGFIAHKLENSSIHLMTSR